MRPAFAVPALCALALGEATCAEPLRRERVAAGARRPNVVVIQTDDQDLASLSARRPDTGELAFPHILGIGASGARFENAFVSLPLCCPSRATLLTGRYAHNHGVLANLAPEGGFAKLDHSETLPVWLRRGGYFTMHAGKYLNGYTEHDGGDGARRGGVPAGWDRWYTFVGDGAGAYFDCEVSDGGVLATTPPGAYSTDVVMQRAAALIAERAFGERPFFLLVDPIAPHATFADPAAGPVPAPRHAGAFAGHRPRAAPSFDEEDVSDKPRPVRVRRRLSPEEVDEIRAREQKRLESLLAVDEGVGLLLDTLERTGLAANTVVIFLSDNGFMMGEHRIRAAKQVPYDESVRVPLLVRGPGITAGTVIPELVGNVDLAPTILDLACVSPPFRLDGRSFRPLLAGEPIAWRAELLLENPVGERYFGLRSAHHKYVEYDFDGDGAVDERELYDCGPDAADPFELDSRHRLPQNAALMRDLHERLERARDCSGGDCP